MWSVLHRLYSTVARACAGQALQRKISHGEPFLSFFLGSSCIILRHSLKVRVPLSCWSAPSRSLCGWKLKERHLCGRRGEDWEKRYLWHMESKSSGGWCCDGLGRNGEDLASYLLQWVACQSWEPACTHIWAPFEPKTKEGENCRGRFWERFILFQVMFETFGVPSLCLANRATLALASYGRVTGLVVLSGHLISSVIYRKESGK